MYDRLLKLIEAQGEIRRREPGTMAGGVGGRETPKSKAYNPTYTASLTRGQHTRTTSTRDAIEAQRKLRGLSNLHTGRKS